MDEASYGASSPHEVASDSLSPGGAEGRFKMPPPSSIPLEAPVRAKTPSRIYWILGGVALFTFAIAAKAWIWFGESISASVHY